MRTARWGAVLAGVGMLALVGCASDDASLPAAMDAVTVTTSVPTTVSTTAVPATTAPVEATPSVAAFCAVYLAAPATVPESYVGTAENVADVDDLLVVSPEPVRSSVQIIRDHLASGSVTSDPATKLRTNWPLEVQQAIDDMFAYVDANC